MTQLGVHVLQSFRLPLERPQKVLHSHGRGRSQSLAPHPSRVLARCMGPSGRLHATPPTSAPDRAPAASTHLAADGVDRGARGRGWGRRIAGGPGRTAGPPPYGATPSRQLAADASVRPGSPPRRPGSLGPLGPCLKPSACAMRLRLMHRTEMQRPYYLCGHTRHVWQVGVDEPPHVGPAMSLAILRAPCAYNVVGNPTSAMCVPPLFAKSRDPARGACMHGTTMRKPFNVKALPTAHIALAGLGPPSRTALTRRSPTLIPV